MITQTMVWQPFWIEVGSQIQKVCGLNISIDLFVGTTNNIEMLLTNFYRLQL
jgi:hypothetical protein